MKYLRLLSTAIVSLLISLTVPLKIYAAPNVSPVIITEMSPGTTISASQEFIELYNQSNKIIDLSDGSWQVQIASSKATSWEKPKTVALHGLFYPGTYLIISSNYVNVGDSKSYMQDNATAQFSSGLTATSGHIRVVYTAAASSVVSDTLEWSTVDSSGIATSPPITAQTYVSLEQGIAPGLSLKRKITNKIFATSGNLQNDFLISGCPSPTVTNSKEYAQLDTTEPVATSIDATNQACTNSEETGDDSSVSVPSEEPPAILLPTESDSSEEPSSSSSSTSPHIPASDVGLSSPSITELLPNPGSPQTDSQDEFIELYNSNDAVFDLSGFQLYIGTTGSKHYTFPQGTVIPARAFKAFFSADTKISLSNTAGKVALYDPLGKLLVQTDEYGTAKDNQAWALANGTWQWTTKPTPNNTNAIAAPSVSANKKKTSAKTASKTSNAKSTASTSKKAVATTNDAQNVSNLEEKRPLHPLALAVVGGFALLYGAYEYRHDMANKFYQLRSYRAARRKNRQEATRR